ncbi:MAG: hypothetical protein GX605_02335, partial [Chloroflexi bacterium]|nr:hypothetical protein [Chloroflexota bacterium]
GRRYAFLLDVAGVDWDPADPNRRRDLTALTIVEIGEERPPPYRVVDRRGWRGLDHPALAAALLDLAACWEPAHVVVDATGLGTGLASSLRAALGRRVQPLTLSPARKGQMGWALLALCDAGRLLDHRPDGSPEQAAFWDEVAAAGYQVRLGGQGLAWGAPPGGHDDWLLSLALVTALEEEWLPPPAAALLPPGPRDRVW